MTQSQDPPPPPPTREKQASEERFVLKALMTLFALAGLIIAVVTIFGGGVDD